MGTLVSKYFLDLGGGPEDCTMLAGCGRSGTTWVGDIINYRNEYRTLFEPFWRQEVPLVAHFRPRQYIASDSVEPTYLEPARKILSGRIRNPFIDSLNTKWIARRRLLKDIRVNLMVGWLKARFPSTPIIFLMRHPCAVTLSTMKLGWKAPLDLIMAQPDLVAAHLEPYRERVEKSLAEGSEYEQRITVWCIENRVALDQLAPADRHVVHYENFCADDPRPEIAGMFAFLGKPFDDSVFEAMRRPSKLSAADSAVLTGGSLVDSWRKQVTPEQIDIAVETLAAFGLDHIYDADPLPHSRR